MTRFVEEALAGEADSDVFARLLFNYGLWSRGGGCRGWFHGLISHESCVIDDESALLVDRAVQSILRERRPKLYVLFSMYYIRGFNEYEITSRLKRKRFIRSRVRRKDYFEYNYAADGALKYLTSSVVRDLIIYSERLIFEEMRQQIKGEAV